MVTKYTTDFNGLMTFLMDNENSIGDVRALVTKQGYTSISMDIVEPAVQSLRKGEKLDLDSNPYETVSRIELKMLRDIVYGTIL